MESTTYRAGGTFRVLSAPTAARVTRDPMDWSGQITLGPVMKPITGEKCVRTQAGATQMTTHDGSFADRGLTHNFPTRSGPPPRSS